MKCTYSKAVQGRSKHLETGPDVNTVKPHPLINDVTSFNQGLAMHRSHCHGLNRGHSFFFSPHMCAWEAFSSLSFQEYHPVLLNR